MVFCLQNRGGIGVVLPLMSAPLRDFSRGFLSGHWRWDCFLRREILGIEKPFPTLEFHGSSISILNRNSYHLDYLEFLGFVIWYVFGRRKIWTWVVQRPPRDATSWILFFISSSRIDRGSPKTMFNSIEWGLWDEDLSILVKWWILQN